VLGVFSESGDRRFKLTAMGQLLRRDHPPLSIVEALKV
jgi:hypothetical protein